MTPEQVVAVVEKYETELKALTSPSRISPHSAGPQDGEAIAHALWMCGETKTYASSGTPDGMEKTCRWLGFIQGVLWMTGLRNIQEMRDENG